MKTAMILAAGRGERLRPLTDQVPKAMCLVKGRPLIEHHVRNLAKAGFTRLIINHAWLGWQIRRHLGDGSSLGIQIHYSPEPPGGLETGGGIFHASDLLGNEPFLTVNADIYTSFPLNKLQLPQNSLAHLLLLGENPRHNPAGDFGLNNNHQLSHDLPRYTFSGIAVYHPEAFSQCVAGRYSVVSLLHRLIFEQRATGELFHGQWIDTGSVERLRRANEQ